MRAKEMFEKLGFEEIKLVNCIVYENTNDDVEIDFEFATKEFHLCGIYYISLGLLKAINKQVEELGWLEEKESE